MGATSPTNGLTTPPPPAAQPLVYITGSPKINKQCVAEYLALLLGDEAILIDAPYTSTFTTPPPSSTPPSASSPTRQRPKDLRLPSTSSSSSSGAAKPCRSRSTSATTAINHHHHPPAPFFDPLLATLSSHPLRTAILTDAKRPANPDSICASQAASQTGRTLIRVVLTAPQASLPSPPPQHHKPPSHQRDDETATVTLELGDAGDSSSGDDPHAAALRIVQLLKEIDARRRRSQQGWEAVNDGNSRGSTAAGAGEVGGNGRRRGNGGKGACVCGVITPALTPAEEREMRF